MSLWWIIPAAWVAFIAGWIAVFLWLETRRSTKSPELFPDVFPAEWMRESAQRGDVR